MNSECEPFWRVNFAGKAEKQAARLPDDMRGVLKLLWRSLEQSGPVQNSWRNYSQITGAKDAHHCHLNNNHPRYVVYGKLCTVKNAS